MHYRRVSRDGDRRLLARSSQESSFRDLTSARPKLRTLRDLFVAAEVADTDPHDLARSILAAADSADAPAPGDRQPTPVAADEIWAAGVTYHISEEAREAESAMPDMYHEVYGSERPEIFFKATPSRTVGPGEAVGIRGDSKWDVPEPELGVVLYDGEIVGYTIGNDVSSRSIEGENPLYLPQAKVYDRCCSIGPTVVAADAVDPHDLAMSMTIERDGAVVYEDRTSTAEMVRTCEELAGYLTRHNTVPELTVLLTGTSLVPEEDFTLRPDDVVRIEIEGIGELVNSVVEV